ncbi:MAG TPA: hypothetical protein PLB22_11410, partial [Ottowia sp.]|nr:hypothetical protein [Ottowia sp.]
KATEKSGEKSAEKATDKALARDGTKPAEAATEKGSARTKPEGRTAETDRRDAVRAVEGKSEARAALADGGKQVALVAQPVPSRAEAESILLRMRSMVSGTLKDSNALQGQVFQTPEGWRAAVWPFSSREEAQLINATLVARGLRTKAVDF